MMPREFVVWQGPASLLRIAKRSKVLFVPGHLEDKVVVAIEADGREYLVPFRHIALVTVNDKPMCVFPGGRRGYARVSSSIEHIAY